MTLKDYIVESLKNSIYDFEKLSDTEKNDYIKDEWEYIERRLGVIFSDFVGLGICREKQDMKSSVSFFDDRNGIVDERMFEKILKKNIISKEDYTDICTYIGECKIIMAIYWYIVTMYRNNDQDKCKKTEQDFNKRVKKIVEDKYSNAKERSESVNLMLKNAKNDIITEICNYYVMNVSWTKIPTVLNIQENEAAELFETHRSLLGLKQTLEYAIERYFRRIKNIILTSSRYDAEISQAEIDFLNVVSKIIPYDDDTVFAKLRKNDWETIGEENRDELLNCIEILCSNKSVVKRYIRAQTDIELEDKIKALKLKIKDPLYYRNIVKIGDIKNILTYKEVSDEDFKACEKYLDKIYEKLKHYLPRKISFKTESEAEQYYISQINESLNIT